jgi:type I restriction enzyme R subunit
MQSEAILENNLIKQLIGLGYASAKVMEGATLVSGYRRTTKNRYLLIAYRY